MLRNRRVVNAARLNSTLKK